MIASRTSPRHEVRLPLVVLFTLALQPAIVAPLPSQSTGAADRSRSAFTIAGRVSDAQLGSPVAGAMLRLSWRSLGGYTTDTYASCGGDSTRRIISNAKGEFEFRDLRSGTYCVITGALGYRADTAGIQLVAADWRGAHFLLEPQPAELGGVRVAGQQNNQTYRIPNSRLVDSLGVRMSVTRSTRSGFPAGDLRELTNRDVAEAITLAEPDLMRALQRTPGVGTRDDYTATMWTRGAPWDQTRIYFDGLPLYNPTHAGWLFSSINPEGVGRSLYMPGWRPAWIGEGAAGVLDLESRRGGEEGDFQASVDVSVVSARVAADGKLPLVDGGWMFSLRRTYIDLLTSAMAALGADSARIPYDFSDAIGRVDVELPGGLEVEASGIYEQDDLRGDFPGILVRNQANWGNKAGQVTLRRPLFGAEGRFTAGITRFGTRLLEIGTATTPDDDPTLPSLDNGLTHWSGTFELASLARARGMRPLWSAGFQYSVQDAEYDGPFSLTAEGIPGVDRDRMIRIPFLYDAELHTQALWMQGLLNVGSRLRLDLGVRFEHGDRVANAGSFRVSPRVSSGFALDTLTTVSAGFARSYQYAQDVGAAAGPLGPQLHLTHIWQLASAGVPALRADITTAGVERWLSSRMLMSVNGYLRRSVGMTVPDPAPGEIRADRSLFKVAENDAIGVEFSLRRQVGDWSGSASYSYADSKVRAEGYTFPSPADVRQSLDLSVSRRVTDALRVSSAFSYASGVPYTRFVIGETTLRLEDPYARRTPAYASADLSLDFTREWGSRTFSSYLQLRNVLNRRNPVTYSGSPEVCNGQTDQSGVCSGSLVLSDRFDSGIPMLPLFGVRVVF